MHYALQEGNERLPQGIQFPINVDINFLICISKAIYLQILYRRVHEAVFKILEANETMELTMASYALLVEIAQVSVMISTQDSMTVHKH